jgi:5-methylcytosine-specific restriction endonuclease McrA
MSLKGRDASRRRSVLRRSSRLTAVVPLTLRQQGERFAIWQDKCAYCGVSSQDPRNCNFGRLAVDHVLALKECGLDELQNVVPACFCCNSSKQDRPVEAWYRAQPFFTEARWRKIQRHCPAAVVGQLPLALPA